MEKIEECISKLESSPLFNLSLASKELFHSNFLAWVIEKDDARAKNLVLQFAPDIKQGWDKLEVEREMKNFDLTVVLTYPDQKQRWVVVENKVKSIPTAEQLNKYSVKFLDCPKEVVRVAPVLLSLTSPDFFDGSGFFKPQTDSKKNGVVLEKWRHVSYSEIAEWLNPKEESELYHESLIKDYCSFVEGLIGLKVALNESFKDSELLMNPFIEPEDKEEEDARDRSLYGQLKEIRMHDICEKWRMIAIKKRVEAEVGGEGQLDIGIGFSNGTGLLDIRPSGCKGTMHFMLQLQGKQLRQVIYENPPTEDRNLMEIAANEKQWFLDSNDALLSNGRNAANNKFCSYGKYFVYRYEAPTLGRLIDLTKKLIANPFPKL